MDLLSAAAVAAVTAGIGAANLAVGRTKDRPKAAAVLRFSGRGKHIQWEADIFKVSAGVTGNSRIGTAFRHTSAQRIDNHIDGAEQFYDSEQPDGNIDSHRRAHCGIAIVCAAARLWTARVTAGGGIAQFCLQCNCFAFCNGEGTAVGIAAAIIQICGSGDICLCGGIPFCKKDKT